MALVTRGGFFLFKAQHFFHTKFLPFIGPLSLISLLFTTLIIFAAQGKQVRLTSSIPALVVLLTLPRRWSTRSRTSSELSLLSPRTSASRSFPFFYCASTTASRIV